MTPEETYALIMRVVRAEAAVTGLRRALRRLVAAEREFSRDTGIKLDDLISEAVDSAEHVLNHTKWSDDPPPERAAAEREGK